MEKERYLNRLIDVIQILRKSESDLARKHLQAYESNHTVNRGKMFQLYKNIKINEIRDYAKLKKRISPDSNDDSFNKLIRRTTDRVQESLIVDVNIRRPGNYNQVFRTKFFLQKQLIQARFLMDRGLRDYPHKMFLSMIRQAKKYELYDELLEAHYLLQVLYVRWSKNKDAERLNDTIDHFENVRTLLHKTKRIQRNFEVADRGKSKQINLNSQQLDKLYNYYKSTKSINIQSIYYLLLIARYKSINDLQLVNETNQKLLDIVLDSPVLYSTSRLLYLYGEIAYNNRLMLNFEDSYEMLIEANRYSKSKSVYAFNIGLSKVNVNILSKNYLASQQMCISFLEENMKGFKYERSVTNYYLAISHFGLKSFKDAQTILSQKNEIEKDKEGWNVWIRIMRLLCSIEMLKLNLIDYDIESFRKYLERTAKQFDVRERDKLVLRVLMELDKNNFDFKLTAKEVEADLQKLKSTNKKYAWNPDSPELILFHDWFECKRLKKDYKPNFEIYREAMRKD